MNNIIKKIEYLENYIYPSMTLTTLLLFLFLNTKTSLVFFAAFSILTSLKTLENIEKFEAISNTGRKVFNSKKRKRLTVSNKTSVNPSFFHRKKKNKRNLGGIRNRKKKKF